jgi:hypothetical protein
VTRALPFTICDGYEYIRVSTPWRTGKVGRHVAKAEAVLGRKLYKNEVVHHIDGDPLNNANDNLLVCQASYHQMLHRRQIALRACGNPSWRRCPVCGGWDEPARMRMQGWTAYHADCYRRNIRLTQWANTHGLRKPHPDEAKLDYLNFIETNRRTLWGKERSTTPRPLSVMNALKRESL